jgi:hypothetical protein
MLTNPTLDDGAGQRGLDQDPRDSLGHGSVVPQAQEYRGSKLWRMRGVATVWSLQDRIGYVVMPVLPQLIGGRWSSLARAAVQTLRPSTVRVITEGSKVSQDSVWWRVNVYLSIEGKIEKVEQECKVPLPSSLFNGQQFKQALDGGC